MPKSFDPAHRNKLDSPERRKLLPPESVLDFGDLEPGQTFLDVGAGIGYFALPALERVGETGMVIAADHSREMLRELEVRAGGRRKNLRLLESGIPGLDLPGGLADRILMAFVLHEVEDRQGCLKELREILRSDGALILAEWKKESMEMGPPLADRLDPEELRSLGREAGFRLIRQQELNPFHYMAVLV